MANIDLTNGEFYRFAKIAGTAVCTFGSDNAQGPVNFRLPAGKDFTIGTDTTSTSKVVIQGDHQSLLHIRTGGDADSDYALHIENTNTSTNGHAMMAFDCNRAGANFTTQFFTMGIDSDDGFFKIVDHTVLGHAVTPGATVFQIEPLGAGTGVAFYPHVADARVYIGDSARADASNEYPMDLEDGDINAYLHVGSSGDSGANMIAVIGDDTLDGGQSDAFVYFGQSHNHGGFVGYQGDSTGPGEFDNLETDRIMVGRVSSGTPEDVIYFAHNSNNVSVLGSLTDSVSDERVKTNVRLIDNAINKIKQIRGVYYDYNEHAVETHYMSQEDWDKGLYKGHVGLIAQEVEKVLPEVVVPAPISKRKEFEDYKTIHYKKMCALLIEGIKEQQETIESLTKRIEKLEGKQ